MSSTSQAELRRGRAPDLPALARLEQACFDRPWLVPDLDSLVDSPDALLLVVPAGDGECAAYALFRRVATEAELLRLACAPDRRRRGLARRLLEQGLGELAAAGCRCCLLEVREQNRAAVRLYEELGFVLVGRRPRYYSDGSDALIYRLALA